MKNLDRVNELITKLKAECEYYFESAAVNELKKLFCAPLPEVEILDENHQRFNGEVYYKIRGGYYIRSKQLLLHRQVWKFFNGEIPKGYIIHHIDGDPDNNALANLQMMTIGEHKRIHQLDVKRLDKKKFVCTVCGKEYEAVDVGTNKYCSVSCQMKDYNATRPLLVKTCAFCGKEFQTRSKKAKFCSSSCASRSFYTAPKEERTCPICGKVFTVHKSRPKIYCSNKCSGASHSVPTAEKICPVCGKTFTVKIYEKVRTCSRECANALISRTRQSSSVQLARTCPVCGKIFKTYPSVQSKTCSRECGNKLAAQTRSLPDDLRGQIRAEYQRGVRGCGARVLAKKYGLAQSEIWRIVNS
ncbi:MAG: HNH endonuclease [Selenomonadaceae bacterium]|nr:HNH endonuclease [Selenomonadaceae bacterium]